MSRGNPAESTLWSKRKLSTSVHRFWRVGAASTSRQIGCATWPNIGRAQWVCTDKMKMSEKCVKKAWKNQVRQLGFVFCLFVFFFATDQAKQNMRETPSEQKIHIFFWKQMHDNAEDWSLWAKMVFGTLRSASTLVKHKRNKYVKRIHPRQVKGYAHRHFPQMDSVTGMTTWCSSTFGMPWSHVLCLSSCWTRIPMFASLIAAQRNTHAPWHTARCFWGPSRMNGLLTKIHVSIAKNEFRLLKEDLLPQHPSGWHVHGSRGQGLRHMSSSKRDVRDPAPVIETFKWSQPLQIWCTCAYNTINKTFSSENINRVMVYCIYIANLQLKPDSKHDQIMLKQTFCLYPYNKIIVFRFYHSFVSGLTFSSNGTQWCDMLIKTL